VVEAEAEIIMDADVAAVVDEEGEEEETYTLDHTP
jgi:hypothetical protein